MKENIPLAVITGPTSGIGETFAHKLASEGYNLMLIARHENKLSRLTTCLKTKYNVNIQGIVADLSVDRDIVKVEQQISLLDRIDLLINNAGFGLGGYFIELPMEKQMDMLNVHLNSTIRFCRAAIPVMATQSVRGHIINVSSFSVFVDVPGSVMYSTSKSAVVHFSKTLQFEVKDYNIKIQALCPVFTPTSFHKSINGDLEFMKNIPDFFWTPKEDVVNTSLRSLHSGKVICIPGYFNRMIYWFNRHPVFAMLIQNITMKLNARKPVPDLSKEQAHKLKKPLIEEKVEF